MKTAESVRWVKLLPLLLVGLGVIAYANTFQAPFVFDDVPHIVNNPNIRRLWPLRTTITNPTRAVLYVSLALNYAVGGLNPADYHVTNLAIHVGVGLLLYGILRRTFGSVRLRRRYAGVASGLAFWIAALWLVHPLATQGVTYVVQRAESLMAFFYLLTLYSAIRAASARRFGGFWVAVSVLASALGMATKQVMATVLLTLLLYDRAFLWEGWREVFRQRARLYGGIALLWGSALVMVLRMSGVGRTAGFSYSDVSALSYALTQLKAITHYLALSFWPVSLCFDYSWPLVESFGDVWAEGVWIAGLVACAVVLYARRPSAGFAAVAFFIVLAPTSSVMPILDPIVEHRMYLPLAAVVAGIGVATFEALRAILRRVRAERVFPACGLLFGVSALSFLLPLTITRNQVYRDEMALWTDVLRTCPASLRAHSSLAAAFEKAGLKRKAEQHYRGCLALIPESVKRPGPNALKEENPRDYYNTLKSYVHTQNNLGLLLSRTGRLEEARQCYLNALRLTPDFPDARLNLGFLLAHEGDVTEAVRQWTLTLKVAPRSHLAHYYLGCAYLQMDQPVKAAAHLRGSVRWRPDFSLAKHKLAWLLATSPNEDVRDGQKAVCLAEDACRATGYRSAAALDVLAAAYAETGDFERAGQTARRALDVLSSSPAAGSVPDGGQCPVREEIQAHLRHYEQGRRVRVKGATGSCVPAMEGAL